MSIVSVIVPNYNHGAYLQERLDSIINQTYEDYELIILDDKSTDNSKEVIEKYRGNKKVAHIVYNEKNSGSTFVQWGKGISLATGKYIWIAESDDVADPELITKMMVCFEQDEKTGLTYSQSYRYDQYSVVNGTWLDHTRNIGAFMWDEDFITEGKDFLLAAMMFQNSIPNASAVMFKKDLLNGNSIDPTMTLNGDWLFYSKLLVKCKIAYISKPLNYFRYHQNKGSIRNVENFNNLKEYYKVLNFLFKNIQIAPSQKEQVLNYAYFTWLIQSKGDVIKMLQNNFKKVFTIARQVDKRLPIRILRSLLIRPFKKINYKKGYNEG